MTTYPELKTAIQWISFGFSICFNSLLVYLILTKSPKKMGNYRYLMIYFSCFAIFFSIIDVIVGPFVHSYGKSFAVLADRRESNIAPPILYFLVCVVCGCYGVIIAFFAIHFLFRYFALERKGRLKYFHGGWFAIWVAVPVLFGALWSFTVGWFLAPTEESTEYLKQSIEESYQIPMENVTFVCGLYWRTTENGKEEMVASSVCAVVIFAAMMGISFSVVCYYGYLSYQRIRALMNEGESSYTKNLQRQLYKALVAQATIPIVLMYLPMSNYLIFSAIGWDISSFSRLLTLVYAAYPAVDPLPLFFIIDNYRNSLADENLKELQQCLANHKIVFANEKYEGMSEEMKKMMRFNHTCRANLKCFEDLEHCDSVGSTSDPRTCDTMEFLMVPEFRKCLKVLDRLNDDVCATNFMHVYLGKSKDWRFVCSVYQDDCIYDRVYDNCDSSIVRGMRKTFKHLAWWKRCTDYE
ncbi:unnamed protein product [Caenorhabditis sp. 36 PRJEB53466]|nr:unnamed protein product [Caenorhabditis sp. 36 PRJEB53466]